MEMFKIGDIIEVAINNIVSFGVPVIFSFYSSSMLHSVLILGIEPNEDPKKLFI